MELYKYSRASTKKTYFPVFIRNFVLFAVLAAVTYVLHYLFSGLRYSNILTVITFFLCVAFFCNLIWYPYTLYNYSKYSITIAENELVYQCKLGHKYLSLCVCKIDHIAEMIEKKTYIKLNARVYADYADAKYGHYGTYHSIIIPKVFDNFENIIEFINQNINPDNINSQSHKDYRTINILKKPIDKK